MSFPVFAPIIIAMFSCSPKLPQYQLSSPKVQSLISEQLPSVSLLKIGGIDARSEQKTPAGVLVVRRGLFFVKRQRRYAAYFQKGFDTYSFVGIITQQLSNSATQQLSN